MGLAELGPGAVPSPPSSIFDGEVLDDATEEGQEVRCVRVDDGRLATDPMPWSPAVKAEPKGICFPKRGNRAVIIEPADGPPVIAFWEPATDAIPDVPLT
jgi:hypothetical protein